MINRLDTQLQQEFFMQLEEFFRYDLKIINLKLNRKCLYLAIHKDITGSTQASHQ